MFLEMQAQLAKSWLDLAENNMRAASTFCMSAGEDSARIWMSLLQGAAPLQARTPMFPWTFGSAALLPALGSFPAVQSWWPGFSGPGFSGLGPSGWGTSWTGLSPATAWLAPFGQTDPVSRSVATGASMMADAMASSYRTAGGHAAAAILFPLAAKPTQASWGWPMTQRFFW